MGDILVFDIMGQAPTSDFLPIPSVISDISAITLTSGDICIGVGSAIIEGFIHAITAFDISTGKGDNASSRCKRWDALPGSRGDPGRERRLVD